MLLLPDEFFHKAAALLFAVEQAGGFHAFLPVEPDLIGPGDEPVESVGRELFAVAGVWQAEKGAQAVRQERAADRRAGKPVVGDVHEEHPREAQEACFQHTEHLQAGQGVGFEGDALGTHEFQQHGLHQRPRQRRVGHAVVLEGGDDALHEAEQAFRIDGETRPDVGLAVARAVLVVAASIDKQCVAQAGKRVRESAEGMDSCPSVHGIPQDPVE